MKDIFTYRLSTTLPAADFIALLRSLLPEFRWHGGDSDAQGPYQSGTSAEGISLKIWLGEKPFDVLLSFSAMPKHIDNRETIKSDAIRRICAQLSETGRLVEDAA